MNEETIQILDQALRHSLWAFLILFLGNLFFIASRLKEDKKKLSKMYARPLAGEEKEPEAELDRSVAAHISWSSQLRMSIRALILCSFLALIVFVVSGFTPLSLFGGFGKGTSQPLVPLRLTLLNYERFYEGFSLRGEVWNQDEEPQTGLKAVIHILKSEQETLDRVTVEVEPSPLPPLSAGTFTLDYRKHSPFLYGYRVTFESIEGLTVPHLKGFDVD